MVLRHVEMTIMHGFRLRKVINAWEGGAHACRMHVVYPIRLTERREGVLRRRRSKEEELEEENKSGMG